MAHAEHIAELLEDLPHYYRSDTIVRQVLGALLSELEKLEEVAAAVQANFFGDQADDTYGLLAAHEFVLGLPVRPAGKSVAQRQSAVQAATSRRFSPAGTDWRASVTQALGTSDWQGIPHYPNDNEITMVVPFDLGTPEFDAVEGLVRPFTPAVYDIVVSSGDGFVVGVSKVGEELI